MSLRRVPKESFDMRRLGGMLVVAVLMSTAVASAASWHRFSDRAFGFSLTYPGDWRATVANVPGVQQLELQRQGKTPYAMSVLVLDIRPGANPQQTVERVVAHEQSTGGGGLGSVHWSAATVGGKPALAGVLRPPTEGGVLLSNAIYVVGWRTHIYEIILTAYSHPSPSRVSQFPAAYARILKSWRFM
jgi:hypothetical protein